MLNYIWVGLIIIGIVSAGGTDIYREVNDTYKNGSIIVGTFTQNSNL